MSLNIQTADGLLEIGGKVTKEKVVSALGYLPANEQVEMTVDTHIKDTDIHITTEERTLWNKNVENLDSHKSNTTAHVTSSEKQVWNNKSDFSGAYADLIDAPDILENGSGGLDIADESGNIILKVDADGLETTTVTARSMVVDGKDILATIDSHASNNTIHVTKAEKDTWNNKSDFSGVYDDLINAPDIVEDQSGTLNISDESGNVILKVDKDGLETTAVITDAVILNGTNVEVELKGLGDKFDNLDSELGSHTSDIDIHITADERNTWNLKATTDYVDQKVANLVNSAPDKLNTLDELAAALGDDENFATTVTNSLAEKASKVELNTHTSDKVAHITADERNTWNNKSDFSGSYTDLTNAPSITEDSSGEVVYTDETGNIIARVGKNGLETTAVVANEVVANTIKINEFDSSIEDIINTYILNIDYSQLEFDKTEIVT